MACSKMLSFAEIVQGRDASVRVTEDGLLYAVDLAMVVTGKDRDHAGQTLRALSDEVFPSLKFSDRKFPGKGNSHTKLVSFQNAIELIMVLPGKVAKETRTKFADIIRRYLGGDRSLITEINANAQSSTPIAQLARASLEVSPTDEAIEDKKRKRKREDMELQEKRIQNMSNFMDLMTRIRPNWMEADARFRLQTEDMIKNILTTTPVMTNATITNGTSNAITNGAVDADGKSIRALSASISISGIAQEHGKRLTSAQAIHAGKLVARKFRAKYGSEPGTHPQWVDGVERPVNSYTERDRALVVDALKEMGIM
jgi:hypothetical protein